MPSHTIRVCGISSSRFPSVVGICISRFVQCEASTSVLLTTHLCFVRGTHSGSEPGTEEPQNVSPRLVYKELSGVQGHGRVMHFGGRENVLSGSACHQVGLLGLWCCRCRCDGLLIQASAVLNVAVLAGSSDWVCLPWPGLTLGPKQAALLTADNLRSSRTLLFPPFLLLVHILVKLIPRNVKAECSSPSVLSPL